MYTYFQPKISVAQEEADIQELIYEEYERRKQEENAYFKAMEEDYFKAMEEEMYKQMEEDYYKYLADKSDAREVNFVSKTSHEE